MVTGSLPSLVDTSNGLLHRLKLCKSGLALLKSVSADHLAEGRDTVCVKEHMLGTGKADALCAKLTRLARVCGCVGIGAYIKSAVLVSPGHDAAELSRYNGINCGDDSVVDISGRAVDGDIVALVEDLAAKSELLVGLIHLDLSAAGDAALAHAASDNCRVAGHAARTVRIP